MGVVTADVFDTIAISNELILPIAVVIAELTATPLIPSCEVDEYVSVIVGITVVLGNAPTSFAVYVGLLVAFAQAGTVGSVSVYDVR